MDVATILAITIFAIGEVISVARSAPSQRRKASTSGDQ
jgi:hypothetical protein